MGAPRCIASVERVSVPATPIKAIYSTRERERERRGGQRSSIWIQSSFPAKSQLFSLKEKSVRGKLLRVCVGGKREQKERDKDRERTTVYAHAVVGHG